MIQIIVVDDHRLFRIGLQATFEKHHDDIRIVGEAESGEELFRLLVSTPAELVLLDVNLPDMWGVEVARRLRREYPALKVLAVSGENAAGTIEAMIEAGIDGFVGKRYADANELATAIRTVMGGVEYFGRDIAPIIYDLYVAKKKSDVITPEFTPRERDIILACRDGLLVKEIAERLGISVNTVSSHKKSIFQKLGINNTVEMVQYALKHGIVRME